MAIFKKRADRIRGIAGSLDGDGVLVADGTSGAGPGIARVFAEAGAHVIIASTDSPAIDIQLRRLNASPVEPSGIVNGVATDTERHHLVDSLGQGVNTFILNPAVHSLDKTEAIAPRAVVALARIVANRMQNEGRPGNIVFITGIQSSKPEASAFAYLRSEMEQLARAMAPNSIRINAIAPGQIGINRRGNPISSRISPLGHVALHPVEIGKAAWFLANDDLSSGITGTTLKIDRGASLLRPEW